MKKKWIVILSAVVILVMLLCALAAPEIIHCRETLGLSLTVKDVTSTSATLQCVRRIGFIAASVETGRAYHLERKTEDGWVDVPELSGEDTAWPLDAQMIPMGISQEQLNYGNIYGKLSPGTYRVCKAFFTYRPRSGSSRSVQLYAQFEIK